MSPRLPISLTDTPAGFPFERTLTQLGRKNNTTSNGAIASIFFLRGLRVNALYMTDVIVKKKFSNEATNFTDILKQSSTISVWSKNWYIL
jgi:hypothetical protein